MVKRKNTTTSSRKPRKGKSKAARSPKPRRKLTKAEAAKQRRKRERAALKGSITRALKSDAKRKEYASLYKEKTGKRPGKRQLDAFIAHTIDYRKRAEKAKRTRAVKAEKKAARSIAARKAAQTRAEKPKEVRSWERERRKLHETQKREIEAAERVAPKWSYRLFRWYRFIYFDVSRLSIDQIATLLLDMKKRGVLAFRAEREVPVGNRGETWMVSPSGYASTPMQFIPRLSPQMLLHGASKYGWPSIKSMRNPGIDWLRFIIIGDDQVQFLPRSMRAKIYETKIETRDTIPDRDEAAWYLAKGKKPNAFQKQKMRELREALEDELDDLEDGENDE